MDTNTVALLIQEGSKLISGLIRIRPRKPSAVSEYMSAFQAEPPAEAPVEMEQVAVLEQTEEGKATSIEVGCVPCVPPDTQILSNPGTKLIKDIKVGDKVIDADGKFTTVIATMKHPTNYGLISITVPYQYNPILLTPGHPVLVIEGKRCKHSNKTLCYPKDNSACISCPGYNYQPKFIPANKVSAQSKQNQWSKHFLLMPRLTTVKDIKTLDIKDVITIPYMQIADRILPKPRGDGFLPKTTIAVNNTIEIEQPFMKLAGYYLAEGSVTSQKRGAQLRLDFGFTELEYANEVMSLFANIFGVTATITKTPPTIRVSVSSKIMGNFFVNLFGKGAKNKNLPSWMLTLPKEKQKALLQGYWNGDGSYWSKDTTMALQASTVSFELTQNLRILLHRFGMIHTLVKTITRPSKINDRIIQGGSEQFIIQVRGISAFRLAKILNYPTPRKWHFLQSHLAGMDDKWVYLPIKEVKRVPYTGIVMNLETESGTYTANGVIVHNCAIGHFGTCSGLLNEAMRFANKDGISSSEVIDRVNICLDELNALERVDLRPQLIINLPPWEKDLANKALVESRSTRHGLEKISTVEDLEKVTAETQEARQDIGRTWFKQKIERKDNE